MACQKRQKQKCRFLSNAMLPQSYNVVLWLLWKMFPRQIQRNQPPRFDSVYELLHWYRSSVWPLEAQVTVHDIMQVENI